MIAYVCASCGGFCHLICTKCGGQSVVDLDTPSDRAARFSEVTRLRADVKRQQRRALEAEAEVARLREALDEYGQHGLRCATVTTRRPTGTEPWPACDCGLDAALALAGGAEEKKP